MLRPLLTPARAPDPESNAATKPRNPLHTTRLDRPIKREDAARATSSEAQPHRQLCLPCRVSACDLRCGPQRIFAVGQSAVHNPVRKSEIHPIKDIEHIDAEFSAHRFAERKR